MSAISRNEIVSVRSSPPYPTASVLDVISIPIKAVFARAGEQFRRSRKSSETRKFFSVFRKDPDNTISDSCIAARKKPSYG